MRQPNQFTAHRPIVLHLDHSHEFGGAEIALARVCEKASSWDPIIATPATLPEATSKGCFDKNGKRYVVARVGPPQKYGASSGTPRQTLAHLWGVLQQAVAVRLSPEFRIAHVVHANTSRAGLYGTLACLLSKKPIVIHLRDMVTPDSLGKSGAWIYRHLVLPKATAVISNSRSTLTTAEPFIKPSALVRVIPSPTGMSLPKQHFQVADKISRIGMVARIDPWKGQALLIQAFANVFKNENVRLVLAGSPAFGHEEYMVGLRTLVKRLEISEQVDFLGHVDNVEELIRGWDVCVQASIRPEPLGQNVLQYLYCGRPTIAANDGGPREWITDGQTGLLFRTGDIDSLALSLQAIRDPELRSSLSSNAFSSSNVPSDQEVCDRHGSVFATVSQGHGSTAQIPKRAK